MKLTITTYFVLIISQPIISKYGAGNAIDRLIATELLWVWKTSIIIRWWLLFCWPKTTLPSQYISWLVEFKCWNKAGILGLVFLRHSFSNLFLDSFPVSTNTFRLAIFTFNVVCHAISVHNLSLVFYST